MPKKRAYAYRISLAEVGPVHDPAFIEATPELRKQVCQWIVVLGLRAKDDELARGLDRFGAPLTPISAATRKHRESAMGPADPNAPPLMPAYAVSRTRLLLTGAPTKTGAEFWWEYDEHTGGSWGKILDYQRKGIGKRKVKRDVIGISPASIARVREEIATRWMLSKLHGLRTPLRPEPPQPVLPEPRLRVIGKTNFEHFTYGIGSQTSAVESRRALAAGQSTGFFQRKPGQGLTAFGGPGTTGGGGGGPDRRGGATVVLVKPPKKPGGGSLGRNGDDAGKARKLAEAKARDAARKAKAEADRQARQAARDAASRQAEADRANLEAERQKGERALVEVERLRIAKERDIARKAEAARKRAETQAETQQAETERQRAELEKKRLQDAEQARAKAEAERLAREAERQRLKAIEAETARKQAEAEAKRVRDAAGAERVRLAKERDAARKAEAAKLRAEKKQAIEPAAAKPPRETVGPNPHVKAIEDARRRQRAEADAAAKVDPGYTRKRKAIPDLIPGQNIADRLKAYHVGTAKVEAIKAVWATHGKEVEASKTALSTARFYVDSSYGRLQHMARNPGPNDAAEAAAIRAKLPRYEADLARASVAHDRFREEIAKILEVPDPGKRAAFTFTATPAGRRNVDGEPLEPISGENVKTAKSATAWLSRVTHKGDTDHPIGTAIGEQADARAHYDHGLGHMQIARDEAAKTVVHEYGHVVSAKLQIGLDSVNNRDQEFLKHRVGNEPLVDMFAKFGHGDPGEMGRKDRFDETFGERQAYYVGKDYGRQATEIFSMGLETLYDDPVGFVTKDSEYARYILGILDGSLR